MQHSTREAPFTQHTPLRYQLSFCIFYSLNIHYLCMAERRPPGGGTPLDRFKAAKRRSEAALGDGYNELSMEERRARHAERLEADMESGRAGIEICELTKQTFQEWLAVMGDDLPNSEGIRAQVEHAVALGDAAIVAGHEAIAVLQDIVAALRAGENGEQDPGDFIQARVGDGDESPVNKFRELGTTFRKTASEAKDAMISGFLSRMQPTRDE